MSRRNRAWQLITREPGKEFSPLYFEQAIELARQDIEPLRLLIRAANAPKLKEYVAECQNKYYDFLACPVTNEAQLGLAIAVAASMTLRKKKSKNGWFCFQQAIIGQQFLVKALLRLSDENRQGLVCTTWQDGKLAEHWNANIVGALTTARVIAVLHEVDPQYVYLPSPVIDGKHKIDLLVRRDRTSFDVLQIKSSKFTQFDWLTDRDVGSYSKKSDKGRLLLGAKRFARNYHVQVRPSIIHVDLVDFFSGELMQEKLVEVMRKWSTRIVEVPFLS